MELVLGEEAARLGGRLRQRAPAICGQAAVRVTRLGHELSVGGEGRGESAGVLGIPGGLLAVDEGSDRANGIRD